MQAEPRGAASTSSHVSFEATRMFSVELMVEKTVQGDLSLVAVHFRSPSATSHALRSMERCSKALAAG
jgi:hypothetical protein